MGTVFTVASVDNAVDEITLSAPHGLATGDGPLAIRAPENKGVLPAPLAAITDYWAIVTSATKVKLATSSANALAATAINLTTNGSGTLYLELGIPYRRARTYTALSQVKAADLNAFQDALLGLHGLLTDQLPGAMPFSIDGLINFFGGLACVGPLYLGGGLGGIISPAALGAGNNNNYAPTDFATSAVLRLTPNGGGSTVTGIAGGSLGRTIAIHNIGAANLTVSHEDANSTAANRILLANSVASVAVRPNGSITLWYDQNGSRWRVLSQNL